MTHTKKGQEVDQRVGHPLDEKWCECGPICTRYSHQEKISWPQWPRWRGESKRAWKVQKSKKRKSLGKSEIFSDINIQNYEPTINIILRGKAATSLLPSTCCAPLVTVVHSINFSTLSPRSLIPDMVLK